MPDERLSDQRHAGDRASNRSHQGLLSWVVALALFLYYCTPLALPSTWSDWRTPTFILVPGLIGLTLLFARRRLPVFTVFAIGLALLFGPASIGAAFVAIGTLARRAGLTAVLALGVAWLLAAEVVHLLVLSPLLVPRGTPPPDSVYVVTLLLATAGIVVATLVGLLQASRQAEQTSVAAADEARGDAEQARLTAARLAEREQIAREMHDVVAHRISLIALHSTALVRRDDLDPATVQETARLIQSSAKQSLVELRVMLSDLRSPDGAPAPPQPTLAELPWLFDDARAAGQWIEVDTMIAPEQVPTAISRHAYRIIQEGLTNARKHAPGAPVKVRLGGGPETVLEVRISNPLADLARPDRSGSGLGLLGVAERVELVGGTVRHDIDDGTFVLAAELPWPQLRAN